MNYNGNISNEWILDELKPNEIFVFGSNLQGLNLSGSAKHAMDKYGAEYGIFEGLTGQSYALPTTDLSLEVDMKIRIKESILNFEKCVKKHPDKIFLLTRVGCERAGMEELFVAQQFKELYDKQYPNVKFPKKFVNYYGTSN